MIDIIDDQTVISIEEGNYQTFHKNSGVSGPDKILFGNDEIVRDISTSFGDTPDNLCIQNKQKAFRKAGEYVIQRSGTLPYGTPIGFSHTFRYRQNYVRITSDITIPAKTQLPRHFSLGTLFLPGKWQRLLITPPVQHIAEGATPQWHKIEAWKGKDVMIGHWHRPPISITFERRNGTQVEVGTGSDLWRWEKAFQDEPEAASYKVILQEDGIRFIREPLMSCFPQVTELSRPYRFTWYLAWNKGDKSSIPQHQAQELTLDKKGKINATALSSSIDYLKAKDNSPIFINIDLNRLKLADNSGQIASAFDFIRGERQNKPCFANSNPSNSLKKIVRSLVEIEGISGLIFSGLEPAVCYDDSHTNQKTDHGCAHWDINETLDCFQWIKHHCNEFFPIYIDHGKKSVAPILKGLGSC